MIPPAYRGLSAHVRGVVTGARRHPVGMTDLGGGPEGKPEGRRGTGAAGRLRAELAGAVRGEVSFGATARALTTMDASNYRRVPLGVVAPRDADDVAAALAVCRAHG